MVDGNNQDVEQLKKVVERCGVLVTMRKKSDFSTDTLVQDLNKLIMFEEGQQPNAHTLPQLQLEIASAAIAAVIKYLDVCKLIYLNNIFSNNICKIFKTVKLICIAIS